MNRKLKITIAIIIAVIFALGIVIYFSGNGQQSTLDNYPYEPDTPKPEPHDGVFSSDYGTLTFNGDGESIAVNFGSYFSAITGIPEGEQNGTYEFLSGNLPPHGYVPVRYDNAHILEITIGEDVYRLDLGIAADDHKTARKGVGVVTETSIPILYSDDYKLFSQTFEKK